MSQPVRVQLSRRKGWRMPPNTVSVARPGKWGNPFRLGEKDHNNTRINDRAQAVASFVDWLELLADPRCAHPNFRDEIAQLRGKSLACWCPLDQPCHADVLLERANAQTDTDTDASRGRDFNPSRGGVRG